MTDVRFVIDKIKFNYRVAAVWIEEGHVLVHKEIRDTTWALPGGGVEIGEISRDAIIREMKEELGVEVVPEKLLWTTENFFKLGINAFHEIGFYYLVTANKSLFKAEPFHGLEGPRLIYKWLPIATLDQQNIQPAFLKEDLTHIPSTVEHKIFTR